jgi:hypothetical protein
LNYIYKGVEMDRNNLAARSVKGKKRGKIPGLEDLNDISMYLPG